MDTRSTGQTSRPLMDKRRCLSAEVTKLANRPPLHVLPACYLGCWCCWFLVLGLQKSKGSGFRVHSFIPGCQAQLYKVSRPFHCC